MHFLILLLLLIKLSLVLTINIEKISGESSQQKFLAACISCCSCHFAELIKFMLESSLSLLLCLLSNGNSQNRNKSFNKKIKIGPEKK